MHISKVLGGFGVLTYLPLALLAQGLAVLCEDDSQFKDVSISELKQLIAKKGATIVDVNSKASFAKAHVTGAVHFGSNAERFETVLPKDKSTLIVAYCGGPECTAWKKAAIKACELGYTNVRHFSGGIQGWTKQKS
ncbi:MAG: rhodanese-like domain-containing protein [Microthrixaceae bacterium]